MRRAELLTPRGVRLRVAVPETRSERARGLRGQPPLPVDSAMLFERARSVHTFGMQGAIAVAGLDAQLVVRRLVHLRPRRLLLPRRGVRHILECSGDVGLRVGDRLVEAQSGARSRGTPTGPAW